MSTQIPTGFNWADAIQPLDPGTAVAVYNPSLSSWTSGFQIATRSNSRYRLLRLSDRSLLPGEFSQEDLRWERPDRSANTEHR
jgi:hypothetical protein